MAILKTMINPNKWKAFQEYRAERLKVWENSKPDKEFWMTNFVLAPFKRVIVPDNTVEACLDWLSSQTNPQS